MKTRIYSRTEWDERWDKLAALGKTMGLMEYSTVCNRIKREWQAEGMDNQSASNGRYTVHLEHCLAGGLNVPLEYLKSVVPERDMAYDWFWMPHLLAAMRRIGDTVPKQWAEAEARMKERELHAKIEEVA